jgi:hypothetical protein
MEKCIFCLSLATASKIFGRKPVFIAKVGCQVKAQEGMVCPLEISEHRKIDLKMSCVM